MANSAQLWHEVFPWACSQANSSERRIFKKGLWQHCVSGSVSGVSKLQNPPKHRQLFIGIACLAFAVTGTLAKAAMSRHRCPRVTNAQAPLEKKIRDHAACFFFSRAQDGS